MNKNAIVLLSSLLLMTVHNAQAGEAPINYIAPSYGGSCAEWKSRIVIDSVALDKLEKNSYSEKPANGTLYTKEQFIVLLGKKLGSAREVLLTSKNKLTKTSDGLVDMRDAALSGFDLSDLNLSYVDFSGADLRGANLSGSTLNYANLHKTALTEANLDHANINHADITKADLGRSHLCEATLFYSDLEDATLLGANLKGARLDAASNIPRAIYSYSHGIFELGLPVPPYYFEQ